MIKTPLFMLESLACLPPSFQRLRASFNTDALPKPILAYCKTGTRSTTLWSLSEAARGRPLPDVLASAKAAGYDMTEVVRRIAHAKPSLLPDHDG
jgi:uncharacterized protein (TIGR01244 family)